SHHPALPAPDIQVGVARSGVEQFERQRQYLFLVGGVTGEFVQPPVAQRRPLGAHDGINPGCGDATAKRFARSWSGEWELPVIGRVSLALFDKRSYSSVPVSHTPILV